jgi:psp operon transcriptional activator
MERPETTTMLGEAPVFLAMLEHASQLAALNKPILVLGERGTGKELVCARLHFLSPRWEAPLVKVNCAALTESLLETELFGHEAGAFTGAVRTHIGRFEQADGGTLILDELGTVPLRMQEKILRVIEYGEFQRVGGTATLNTDVRIVGATNEDLPALAQGGRFRADLLDRLAFDVIHVPPLRARQEDILTLAHHFALNITSELKRPYFPGFSASAASALLGHSWPGNVRELKNTVERSVFRAGKPLKPVNQVFFDPFTSPFAAPVPAPLHRIDPDTGDAGQSAAPADNSIELPLDYRQMVAEFERDLLIAGLSEARYNQALAAELLGLSYHQLRSNLRKHDLLNQLAKVRKQHREARAASADGADEAGREAAS